MWLWSYLTWRGGSYSWLPVSSGGYDWECLENYQIECRHLYGVKFASNSTWDVTLREFRGGFPVTFTLCATSADIALQSMYIPAEDSSVRSVGMTTLMSSAIGTRLLQLRTKTSAGLLDEESRWVRSILGFRRTEFATLYIKHFSEEWRVWAAPPLGQPIAWIPYAVRSLHRIFWSSKSSISEQKLLEASEEWRIETTLVLHVRRICYSAWTKENCETGIFGDMRCNQSYLCSIYCSAQSSPHETIFHRLR